MENAAQRLVIALDDLHEENFFSVISETRLFASTFKIGLALFVAHGPKILQQTADLGAEIFLDLKLHDIPMQIAKAVSAAMRFSPRFLTVHAQGGRAMLKEAANVARESGTKVIAVSVLTSLGERDFHELGYTSSVKDGVKRLADLAFSSGIDGLVCSPHELRTIREEFGMLPYLICPGIRAAGDASHDQARIMGPADAIRAGANALVMGRPITQAHNVLLKAQAIHREIEQAVSEQKFITGSFNET